MDEYGTVNDSQSFNLLLRYSPLHNIKEDINYPAMLLITGENDDRIPPFSRINSLLLCKIGLHN